MNSDKSIIFGTQYYRPPFPIADYWEDDFAKIRDAGLNCVQLWVLWSWVESTSDVFRYDDYDKLIELADKYGLGVVISTVAAVQPYWIFHKVPDSEMVDCFKQKVISTNRTETHFGISPGGCFDHPEVWNRMRSFIESTVKRYCTLPNLLGWDAWNELRWNVHADSPVCYCRHTIDSYHQWLLDKYTSLDNINRLWQRRYSSLKEIDPGRVSARPYTDMIAFNHFLMDRANKHGEERCRLIREIDSEHIVTVHGAAPSPLWLGEGFDTPLNRGNDWNYADKIDGIGCSSFPIWERRDDASFAVRMNFLNSAARGKSIWLSELQGGRCGFGLDLSQTVDAQVQQYWVWNGIANQANAIIFWNWRDEVFGKESANFGLIGNDGGAEKRIEAIRKTGSLLKKHNELLTEFSPDLPETGVFFSPQSYFLYHANEGRSHKTMDSLSAYCRALICSNIPYKVIEETHLEELDNIKILFLPRVDVISNDVSDLLCDFVRHGGTIVCESECGAFDPYGIYRYPENRFLVRLANLTEHGRRPLSSQSKRVDFLGKSFEIAVNQWFTPLKEQKDELLTCVKAGKGNIIYCNSYLGDIYMEKLREVNNEYSKYVAGFELFVKLAVEMAGIYPVVEQINPTEKSKTFLHVKAGKSKNKRMIYIFRDNCEEKIKIRLPQNTFESGKAWEMFSENRVIINEHGECTLPNNDWGIHLLIENYYDK